MASSAPTITRAEAIAELARRKHVQEDFRAFIAEFAPSHEQPAQHHMPIVEALQDMADGRKDRVIIMMPPGSGKSRYAAQLFPAFLLGKPGNQVIGSAYGAERVEQNGRDTRKYIREPQYAVCMEATLSADSGAAYRFEVEHAGDKPRASYYAASVGAGITGFRADYAIVDDALRGWKDADSPTIKTDIWNWYLTELRSRAKEMKIAILFVMTRWAVDDPIGRILPEDYKGESGWIKARDGEMWWVLRIPAQCDRVDDPVGRRVGQWLWPEKVPISAWKQEETSQSVRGWTGLYQQLPISATGGIIKEEWIKIWPADQPLPVLQFVIQSYDTAFSERTTAAESACTVWGIAHIEDRDKEGQRKTKTIVILLDCWAEHLAYPDLRLRARKDFEDMRYGAPPATHGQKPAMFGPTSHLTFALEGRRADVVLIEEKATGGPLLHDLHRAGVPVRAYNPGSISKENRLNVVSPMFSNGSIYVPESKAPERKGKPRDWAQRWVNEITAAGPGAAHWDLADSTSQALSLIRDQNWIKTLIHERPDPLTKDRLNPDDVRRVKRRTEGNVYAA